MLLNYRDLLAQDPIGWAGLLLVTVLGVVSAVTVHEAAHAWSALRLGDRTAALLGRVTLNPRAHLDPAGSLLFLLAFFGWGKPTPVNPANLRGNPETGMAIVSVAGPVSNLALAFVLSLPVRAGVVDWQPPFRVVPFQGAGAADAVADVLGYAILFNVFLAVFNLLPLPPLDGFKVAVGTLPPRLARLIAPLERYGPMPLIGLFLLEFVLPVGVLSGVLIPVADLLGRLVVGQPLR